MRTFQDPLFEEFLAYSNPLFCSGDGGMGDLGGGVGLADVDPGAGDAGSDIGAEPVDNQDDFIGVVEGTDAGFTDDRGEDEPLPEGEEADPNQRPQAATKDTREVLPKELSKALRELKSAHSDNPEILKAVRSLNDAFYANRAYKEIFPSPDDARTTKAALDAVGGPEGIASMRGEISSIERFDRMASEGNPKVIDGLADEFPDGFKRLVPAALDRLSKTDQAAYRETMRGPLLQMLEGDGIMEVIGIALEELKGGNPDRASSQLGRIAAWYNQVKDQETAFKTRNNYQDPRVQELDQRRQELEKREVGIHRDTVVRDLRAYRNGTMKSGIDQMLAGKNVTPQGRARFEQNIVQEIAKTLNANQHYNQSIMDLISQGKVEQATAFAKPYIDRARRDALRSVYSDLYGNAPVTPQRRAAAPPQRTGEQRTQVASDKPVPVRSKPSQDEVDWSKDPKGTLFVTSKAYLKNGKFVTWAQPQR